MKISLFLRVRSILKTQLQSLKALKYCMILIKFLFLDSSGQRNQEHCAQAFYTALIENTKHPNIELALGQGFPIPTCSQRTSARSPALTRWLTTPETLVPGNLMFS